MFFCEQPKGYDNIYFLSSYVHPTGIFQLYSIVHVCISLYGTKKGGLTLLYKILSVRIKEKATQ